ncbi:MAG: hypothetical protein MUD01_26995, partial [Chloroflexaceae bacterium]|nr:hypothetical protein [Chloroflexaceae bacterium]
YLVILLDVPTVEATPVTLITSKFCVIDWFMLKPIPPNVFVTPEVNDLPLASIVPITYDVGAVALGFTSDILPPAPELLNTILLAPVFNIPLVINNTALTVT